MTKAKCQQLHAIKRAASRYGIDLTESTYEGLCRRIKNSEGKFIRKQSNRVSVWEINCQSKKVLVTYDKIRHTIVTFLPPESNIEQPDEWVPPATPTEAAKRLEDPKCPKCKGFGRKYKWFSSKDVIDFECINCSTTWCELLHFA